MKQHSVRNQDGLTLVEMLVSMTVFLIVLAGSLTAIGAQSRGFTKGTDEMGILQNLRYGVDQMEQEIRTAGANVSDRQPAVVYAGTTSLSFNSDLVSNLLGDISAVYIDPNAPAGQVSGMTSVGAMTVPGSAPAFVYPLAVYPGSAAETVTFWFSPDTMTARTDDYVLMRQVNDRAAEALVRNALAPAAGPFFRYHYLNAPPGANPTTDTVPTAWLPLRHSAPNHGTLPDTGAVSRIDDLRAVEVRYRVTNTRPGVNERIRDISTIIPMPNVGVKKLKSCGDEPLFVSIVTATLNGPAIDLTWNASVDEAAGEQDVIRYAIWRRIVPAVDWGDPYASVATGSANYLFPDPDVTSGLVYEYAVAAQDCTPSLSPRRISNQMLVP